MSEIIIATCDAYPTLFSSDDALRAALEARECTVTVRPWQAPNFWVDARGARAVVVRATWDYPLHIEAFQRWLSEAAGSGLRVFNPPELMRWNTDKRYLVDLAARGVATPVTAVVQRAADLADAFRRIGGDVAVIKPCHGASGRAVEQVDRAAGERYLAEHGGAGRHFLVQEMLPEITAGELSFVFLGGQHTHTVRKTPAAGEFRVNTVYGPASNALTETSPELIAEARDVLERLPARPMYARIDGIERAGRLICLEAEVIEPGLFLHLWPASAETFAEAVLAAS